MKLSIANYANGGNKGKGSRNLVIQCNDLQWIERHFGDRKITCKIDCAQVILSVDPHGRSRWGKVQRDGMRRLSIIHDTDLRLFGATYINMTHIDLKPSGNGDTVILHVPSEEELVTPIKANRRRGKAALVKIALGDAVRAVNIHKQQWGQDLVLSIDGAGQLHALIEFS